MISLFTLKMNLIMQLIFIIIKKLIFLHQLNLKKFLIRFFISITETQENKLYVYNKSGSLLSGFPVYGTSIIDLGDLTKNGKTNFVVKGAAKNILLYEIH